MIHVNFVIILIFTFVEICTGLVIIPIVRFVETLAFVEDMY